MNSLAAIVVFSLINALIIACEYATLWRVGFAPRAWLARLTVIAALTTPTLLRGVAITVRHGGLRAWEAIGSYCDLLSIVVVVTMLALWLACLGLAVAKSFRVPKKLQSTPDAESKPDRRVFLRAVGAASVGASAAPLLWGFANRLDIEHREVIVHLAKLPKELDGFRIVQMSDIHIGAMMAEKELAHVARVLDSIDADLLVNTGDLVNINPAEIPLAVRWLSERGARARHGVLSIMGNHEYYIGANNVIEAHDKAGVRLLRNAGFELQKGLWIAGLDDLTANPRLHDSFVGCRDDSAKILLCHQPAFFDRCYERVDLQLSGHTHGGQIWPVGTAFAPLVMRYREGMYRRSGSYLWVNRGLGVAGPPSRVGVRPEITSLILVSSNGLKA